MAIRTGEAEWQGSLSHGTGVMRLGSGVFEGRYSFGSRFGNEAQFGLYRQTNPEELIAAAHAGCFSMPLAHELGRAGCAPKRVHTSAKAQVEPSGDGFKITGIHVDAIAEVPRIDEAKFSRACRSRKARLSRVSGTRRDRHHTHCHHTHCAADRDLSCAMRRCESRPSERQPDHAGSI